MTALAIACLVFAFIPCAMFIWNLRIYRPPAPPRPGGAMRPAISVLIPARNEEANIAAALESVLSNRGAEFEVVILDDHSTDQTARIALEYVNRDGRVRLKQAPALPPGWCGKQHACWVLAKEARFPLLLFMDADVRLSPDALARTTEFLTSRAIALGSGVPRQQVVTFGEKLLIPLIHFVLLGFLPMSRMRRTTSPAYAAGCGQLFIARADAYHRCGGHGSIRASLHDGVALPKAFRQHHFKTDLFDATEVASCRMYQSTAETTAGLAKNATEGLAAPSRIVPFTSMFLLGHVLPPALLLFATLNATQIGLLLSAFFLSLTPRLIMVRRFRQPLLSAVLHPLGVLWLLTIQWQALARRLLGRPSSWRGRVYPSLAATFVAAGTLSAAETNCIPEFALRDQHERLHRFIVPATNLTVIVVADYKGSEQLEKWIKPVAERFPGKLTIMGVADVGSVPSGLRSMVQRAFVKQVKYPVMLDWSGEVSKLFQPVPNVANVYLVQTNGCVAKRWSGVMKAEHVELLTRMLAPSTK